MHLRDTLNDAKPDLIVATGDFTQSGRRSEFEQARDFLASLNSPVLAMPGNHDAPVYDLTARFLKPWSRFEKYIATAEIQAVSLGGLSIIGVNSARRAAPRLNWAYGRLRRAVIERACELALAEQREGNAVIVACHHPFQLGSNKAGSEIVGNGAYALEKFAECGVSAVMTGHVHMSSAVPLPETDGRILSIQAGTAVSTRERGERPAFSFIEKDGDKVDINIMLYSSEGFQHSKKLAFEKAGHQWRSRDEISENATRFLPDSA